MANLVLALDHETLQELKDHACAELLIEKLFGTEALINHFQGL